VATFDSDPVARGLIASLNRPGGNATGVSVLTSELEAKRLGLLRELVPQATTLGVLLNPNFPAAAIQLRDLQEAARAAGRQLGVYAARILKGEKAADLPVMQPTKFQLTFNLGAAKALGLDVPAKLLTLVDEVIE